MVTIIYRVLAVPGKEQEFKTLADDVLIPAAQNTPGCQLFSLFQNTANSREFIFYEKWEQHADVDAYKQTLIAVLGEPKLGEEFPAKMNSLIAEDEDLI